MMRSVYADSTAKSQRNKGNCVIIPQIGSSVRAREQRDSGHRLLPVRDRARYAEEFRSELWEIAHAGGGRRAQLAYAARQVMAARQLRAGLRVPRRRGAVP